MKNIKWILCFSLLLLIFSSSLSALIIKMGSIAPDRSPWNDALNEIGREWQKITNGLVELKIFPGGIAGNEEDMIRKMRLGTLGGAALTNVGITKIYRDAMVMNTPFLFTSAEELNSVLDNIRPLFEKRIEEKGFKVIIWTLAGWLNFFTKYPVFSPDDMKKHKISFSTGEPEQEQAWKKSGYQVIPTDLKDLMMALQSGMVNACYLPPLVAGSGQYFAQVPNMCSLKISPLLGGIVLSDKIWAKIPEQFRAAMLECAPRIASQLNKKIVDLEAKTIKTMKEHGLVINDVPAGVWPKWKEATDKGMDELINKAFSKEVYEQVINHLNQFRQKHNPAK